MPDPSYYNVPDVVQRYYPELINTYIRAAQAQQNQAYANANQPEYNPYADILGGLAKGSASGVTNYLAEEQKSRLAEDAANRTSERAYELERLKAERTAQIEDQRTANKANAEENTRNRQASAIAEFWRQREPQPGDAMPLAAKYIEDLSNPRRTPDLKDYVLPEVNFHADPIQPPANPGETLAKMYINDPAQGQSAAEGLFKLGKEGAGKEFITEAMTPYAQLQRKANLRKTNAEATNLEALPDQKAIEAQRKQDQLEATIANREAQANLKQLGLELQNIKLTGQLDLQQTIKKVDEVRMQLMEEQIRLARDRANKIEAGGTEKTQTPDQLYRLNSIRKEVTMQAIQAGLNITDPAVKEKIEAETAYRYRSGPTPGAFGAIERMQRPPAFGPPPQTGVTPGGSPTGTPNLDRARRGGLIR